MVFASRKKSDDRFFVIKTLLFVIGASLGIAGMVSQHDWLVWTAMGCLAAGIILRLVAQRMRDAD